jgi:hypothetical protein
VLFLTKLTADVFCAERVRISRRRSPLSPTAVRVALMRLVSADPIRCARPDCLNNIVLADNAVAVATIIEVSQTPEVTSMVIPRRSSRRSGRAQIFKEIKHFTSPL